MRTTLLLEDWLVQLVRQQFHGNVSRGVNEVLRQHMVQEAASESLFGAGKRFHLLRGFVEDEEREEARHAEHGTQVSKKRRRRWGR